MRVLRAEYLKAIGAATTGFDPANPATWIQGGVAVIATMVVIWLFYKEYVVPGPTHRRVIEELARKDKLLDAKDAVIEGLHELIENRELQTMSQVSHVLGDVVELLKQRRSLREGRGHDDRDS